MKILMLLILLLVSNVSLASVSLPEFKKLVEIFHKEYDAELKTQNARFVVNNTNPAMDPDFWWNMPQVHASYSSITEDGVRTHMIFFFGGYAKLAELTIEGAANTLCHELGHGIGGAPFKDKTESYLVATEGQADYYATRVCIKRILKYITPSRPVAALDGFIDSKCRDAFKTSVDIQMCYRGFQTLENERMFFKQEENGKSTFYDRPDLTVATKTNTAPDFYPDSQCRLDTMVNGILAKNRPSCWFKN